MESAAIDECLFQISNCLINLSADLNTPLVTIVVLFLTKNIVEWNIELLFTRFRKSPA